MMKLGATGFRKFQLSFALLFMPIRAISDKRTISNFCCMSGGGTSNLQGGAIAAGNYGGTVTLTISNTEFKSNTAQYNVSETLSIC
tara:strand:- start:175 stop:432 length:258 start_codon:yes stop_codon:yes gene_type:complete